MQYNPLPQNPGASQPPLRPTPPRPRGTAAFWVAIILGILLLLSLALNMLSFHPLLFKPKDVVVEVLDRQYGDPEAQSKIAVITVQGALTHEDPQTLFGGTLGPVSFLERQLAKAKEDEDVKAVIIEINSPGGTVAASDEMHHMIEQFKKDKGVPVVVFMKELAASGGYYIAANADHIVATHTTVTGSIGVIMMLVDMSEAMEYLRIKFVPLTSRGGYKDVGSPFRRMTGKEKEYLQNIVNGFYDRFVEIVFNGRRRKGNWEKPEDVEQIADGRIYNAKQAIKNHLIDEIGYFEKAYDAAIRLAPDVRKARVVRYRQKPRSSLPFIFGSATPGAGDINIVKIDAGDLATLPPSRFLYMWQPGIWSGNKNEGEQTK